MLLSARVSRHLPTVLLWAGMAACVAGLVAHRLWQALPFPRFFEHVLLAGLALLAAWPLQRWLHWSRPAALCAVWLLALAVFAGPLPMLAVGLLAASAIAFGSLVMPGPVALPLGLAIIAGTLGWSMSLPIHHRALYLIAAVASIAWRRRAIVETCRGAWRHFDDATRAVPGAATAAILLLGLASTGAWLPTMQYDDVAYHLGLPWQLQDTARYAMDPVLQVWALAPWAGDVLQGVAQVLAGGEARGALDALWLALAAAAVFALTSALGGARTRCWWAVALLGSLPISMNLVGGMQTELPAMALLPLLAWLVLRDANDAAPRMLLAGAIVFGALCGLKLMHAMVAMPMLGWAAWRHRARIPWHRLPLAVLVAIAIGGSSYFHAWTIAGNPFLPLFNGIFRSPYFPTSDFNDARWQAGLDPGVLWRIGFDTDQYYEAFDGGFGFVLIALGGVWLLALRDPRTRAVALVATLGILLPLLPLQYARYLQPALVLLLPALVAAYPSCRGGSVAFWALCVLNLAFATNANWMLRTGALKRTIFEAGSAMPLFERYLPERAFAARLREAGDDGTVLLLPGSSIALAELGQRGRNLLWYSPRWQAEGLRADADPSGQAWARLLHDNRIAHVFLRPATLTAAQRAGLQRSGAVLAASAGEAQWWRIPDNTPP